MQVRVNSALAMEELGRDIASVSEIGAIIYLQGELGVGKTTLVRGFLRGLGYKEHVRSPTFNLFETYEVGGRTICHLDLYRFKEAKEILYTGVMDYFDGRSICLVEWPERGENYLPKADLFCSFNFADDFDLRVVDIIAKSSKGDEMIKKLEGDS